jgi:hypothetical protein
MQRIPAKKMTRFHFLAGDIFPARNKIYPITRLNNPHRTLTAGEDRPLPGGFAKGDGNGAPETPWMKCGTMFARNIPAKKQATKLYHFIMMSFPGIVP